MDSEMYSDCSAPKKARDIPFYRDERRKDHEVGKMFETILDRIDDVEESVKSKPDSGNLNELVVSEVEKLLADVKDLKRDMTESESGLVAEMTDAKMKQVQAEMKLGFKQVHDEVAQLKVELDSVKMNLENLYYFVSSKERGRPVRLKGGHLNDKFIIQALKVRSEDQ